MSRGNVTGAILEFSMHNVWANKLKFILASTLVVACSCLIGWAYLNSGTTANRVLHDERDWPAPIQELDAVLDSTESGRSGCQVLLLDGEPSSTLSQVICRIQNSGERWSKIVKHLELEHVENRFAKQWLDELKQNADESWWPRVEADSKIFVSKRLRDGEEGDLYVATVDRDSRMIFIYYEFNF